MYKGELMEEAQAANLYREALHPYTKLLFSSAAGTAKEAPAAKQAFAAKEAFAAKQDSAAKQSASASSREKNEASCSFASRCGQAVEKCFCEHPELAEIKSGHSIRCFNFNIQGTSKN